MDSIPAKPKIPIGNYLLKLINNKDKNRAGIYVENAAKKIEEIWKEIVNTKGGELEVRNLFPERFGITCGNFYDYKNSKKAIPLESLRKLLILWGEFCNKNEEEIRRKWDEIFKCNLKFGSISLRQKVTLPKFLTPRLSYIIGWICGDGSLNKRNSYVIKLSEKSKPQLEFVLKPMINQIFNVQTPIFQKSSNGFAIQIGSKPIFKFLTRVLRIKVGKIPRFIKYIDNSIKSKYLAGFFDADGYVNHSYKDSAIELIQANRNTLESLVTLFEDLGIHFKGPYTRKNDKGTWYHIRLRRKSEILKFISKVGSNHIKKSRRLKILEGKIEENWGN